MKDWIIGSTVAVLYVVFAVGCVVVPRWLAESGEVRASSYGTAVRVVQRHPSLKPILRKSLEDGALSYREWKRIMDAENEIDKAGEFAKAVQAAKEQP